MALSLAVHGLAVVLLLAAGAAGSAGFEEPALLVEVAFVTPSSSDNTETSDASEMVIELPPSEEPPPVDWSMLKPVELVPTPEPPPVDVSELKPAEPPKPPPPPKLRKPQQQPAARPASPKAEPAQNFGSAAAAQQAASGFMPTTVVWEGKPRYRHPPTPPAYPPRAVELNQQGEVVLRVRLDPQGAAVEILVHRPSGHQLLDRAAVAAVRSWHFLPAVRDGRAVSAWVEIPVRFHLR
jgi:periplasmic protein TonB